MPLEAVMICLDNSDYTRNGDYMPTRFDSQTDAANLLCGAKTNQNPENAVGILASAGDRIEVMVTPTPDLGRLVTELNRVTIGGSSDLLRAIQTAQLALKHRQNKKQKQRIIAFVGSPVTATEKELETLGKNLKKNSVALDLVSFGEVEENAPKLEKLMNALNSQDTSHLLEAPVGPKLLSDILLSSPIVNPEGEAGAGGEGGEAGFEFGINPNEDPELALALRISMEEERARQQAAGGEAPAGGEAAPAGQAPAAAAPAPASGETAPAASLPVAPDAAVMEAMGMEDMDDELRQALLLSMQEMDGGSAAPAAAPATAPAANTAPAATAPASQAPAAAGLEGMEDMDDELRQALLLSMQEETAAAAAPADAQASAPKRKAEELAEDAEMKPAASSDKPAEGGEAVLDGRWLQDPSFVQELLGSLPGVDIDDPRIQDALKEVSGGAPPKKDGDGSDDKKEDKK
ncbi:RPN10 [Symbiodinium pilosum]|uniref:RPN10 protein n=1 Tax=Symbiodinium pilosum TaxID=2952 RepID=A0A812IRV3_SYMPI|nr:RPN10 [Symbiodinium pilosum]